MSHARKLSNWPLRGSLHTTSVGPSPESETPESGLILALQGRATAAVSASRSGSLPGWRRRADMVPGMAMTG